MKREVTIPEISENVESGVVAEVLVSQGDTVEKDQPLMELETDKAALDLPAPFGGTVAEIRVSAGDTVDVGQVVMVVEAEDEEAEEAAGEEDAQEGHEAGETQEESGRRDEPEPEPSEAEGGQERKPEPEEEAPGDEAASEPSSDEGTEETPREASSKSRLVPAAPSVRRFARELGIDIGGVPGSGPGGRISHEDVKDYAKGQVAAAEGSQGRAPGAAATLPDLSRWGEVERQPVSRVRRLTAEKTHESWTTIPHVTHFDNADITEVEAFRGRYKSAVRNAGGKLTITAILVKISALALRTFPRFNSAYDLEAHELVLRKYVHVGVAVDTERGLLVPIIRDADRKSITNLAVELGELAERTRNKKVKPDELQGGSFTVSNLGGIGGTAFTPVVYHPQVAILGVARASQQPVYDGNDFRPRLILPLSLSYDHRVIDGADGARFLAWIVRALESPLSIFMEEA